jgi:hypothetical protein
VNIEDHLIKMKGGKLYCPVYVRIALFREKCPIHEGWGIVTECVDKDEQSALFQAAIIDPNGRVIATGFKREHKAHFPDFEEKAGTGAVGRALLFAGFGTQYALDELDEGERIVDAPIPAPERREQPKPESGPAEKAYKAAAVAFINECKRIWGEGMITPSEAKGIYRKMYGTETMTTQGLMDAVTRLSTAETPEEVVDTMFVEE